MITIRDGCSARASRNPPNGRRSNEAAPMPAAVIATRRRNSRLDGQGFVAIARRICEDPWRGSRHAGTRPPTSYRPALTTSRGHLHELPGGQRAAPTAEEATRCLSIQKPIGGISHSASAVAATALADGGGGPSTFPR